jgi:hypothetical protein
MERIQKTFKISYHFTTSHDPEGIKGESYVWAVDVSSARRVFNIVNSAAYKGYASSTNKEILKVEEDSPAEGIQIYEL